MSNNSTIYLDVAKKDIDNFATIEI